MARRFEEVQRESGVVNYTIGCMHGMAGSLSYGFGQIMSIAVICTGAPLAIQGNLSVGALIACVLLSGQIMQPLQRGLAMWIRFQDIALARARLSKHAEAAKAIDYMLKRWEGFTRFLDDGRLCLSNNAAERALRHIACGRKSWMFCGSDRGGQRAAVM